MSLRTQATESINKMVQTIKNDQETLEQEISEKEKIKRKIEILKNSINSIITISPEEIKLKTNIRHKVDEGSAEFKKLCESIKKFGLMKNIVAELQVSKNEDSYEIICVAGHRRLTALKKLDLKERIPCLIKSYQEDTEGNRVGAALSENLNREGLNCVDIANGYKELKNSGWSDEELIKHFEKSKNTINQYLRVADFPEDIKDAIRNNPEKLSTRVIFRDILTKGSAAGEIRKLINRKIETNRSTSKRTKTPNIKDKLSQFFNEKQFPDVTKSAIIEAFQFVGLWK